MNNGFDYQSFFEKLENQSFIFLENGAIDLDDFLNKAEDAAIKILGQMGYKFTGNVKEKLVRPVYWELNNQGIISVDTSFLLSEIGQNNSTVKLNSSENPDIDYKKYEKYLEPIIKPINGSPARNL